MPAAQHPPDGIGGEHFFHRKLHVLKKIIVDAWR